MLAIRHKLKPWAATFRSYGARIPTETARYKDDTPTE